MTRRTQFQWDKLVLTVSDDRPQSEVNVAGGLARAAQILRRQRATVDIDTEHSLVRFSPSWWGDKWMWAVNDGEISVVDRNGQTVVEVRGSIMPIALIGVATTIMVVASLPPFYFALLMIAAMTGGNYAVVIAGMNRLLRDTLSPPEHWSSF